MLKSMYDSRFLHHSLPQNELAMRCPVRLTGSSTRPRFSSFRACLSAVARRSATGTYRGNLP